MSAVSGMSALRGKPDIEEPRLPPLTLKRISTQSNCCHFLHATTCYVPFVSLFKKEGTEHALTNSGRRSLREEACRLARGETPSPRSCTDRRFKDGQAAFPQEWRCGGRQGWSADRQRVGTRLGVRRTGRPPRSAPY